MKNDVFQIQADDGHRLSAYRAEPKGKPKGAICVVMEMFGVNGHIRSIADSYAAEGYLAIAPYMFDRLERNFEIGYSPPEVEIGRSLLKQFSIDDGIRDVGAAISEVSGAGRVGILGYCIGGTVAWRAASQLDGLSCAIAYYGGGIPNLIDCRPKCPVQFHWAELDHSLPLERAQQVAAVHNSLEHYFYHAGHGFNCDQRQYFDAESANLARHRAAEFIRKNVG